MENKERPILFNGAMVRAILDGRKTQTRRIAKVTSTGCKKGFITPLAGFVPRSIENHISYCPHGVVGDRLWVRETFSSHIGNYGESIKYFYRATHDDRYGPWKPSIHMPRSASRILIGVANVRVERLNDLSESDAIAEGLKAITKDGKTIKYGIPDRDGYPGNDNLGWNWCGWNASPVLSYKRLWESINGQGSWINNPWVWVIEFKEIKNG